MYSRVGAFGICCDSGEGRFICLSRNFFPSNLTEPLHIGGFELGRSNNIFWLVSAAVKSVRRPDAPSSYIVSCVPCRWGVWVLHPPPGFSPPPPVNGFLYEFESMAVHGLHPHSRLVVNTSINALQRPAVQKDYKTEV
jgi:hypothetical protein